MTTTPQPLDADLLGAFAADFASRPAARLAMNAVTQVGIDKVALDQSLVRSMSSTVSVRLDDWKVTNQKKSGRCWLFAALNLIRSGMREKLGVKDFELSQNHAMYWDKLERSNYFLESVLATADLPVDDRLVAFLLREVLGDGGQWNMAVSVFTKHGVVPKEVMPETESSSDTRQMNLNLQRLLRQGARDLRAAVAAGADPRALQETKREILAVVHRVLTVHLGVPPTSFEWQWRGEDKAFHRAGTLTPTEFYAAYSTRDLSRYVCLVDDPRPEHPKGATLTVEHLGNVVGGDPVLYLNVEPALAKRLAAETIASGEPVWFGCDVGPMMDRTAGLWDAALFDYAGVYDAAFTLDKADRVRHGDSAMTHAMLFTGVDLDEAGAPRRWRVENSWGSDIGQEGFFTMNDSWFDAYVFEVAVDRERLPEELRAALEVAPIVLPAWDPMGALA